MLLRNHCRFVLTVTLILRETFSTMAYRGLGMATNRERRNLQYIAGSYTCATSTALVEAW